jgi:hypothetical protein
MCYNAMIKNPHEHYRFEGSSPSIGIPWKFIVMNGVLISLNGEMIKPPLYVFLWKQRLNPSSVMSGKRQK